MTYLELSDNTIEYSIEFPVKDITDIMQEFEEMLRMYAKSDIEIDAYIINRADEIFLKNSN